ncbi:Glycosidase [Vibrio vulnificus]|nr:Glycosidase [Vibrio vulnificus]ANH65679.1 Glycosidase [Vibrio vulnificus]QBH29337.1 Glycosidase [Vibrio vulnificus]
MKPSKFVFLSAAIACSLSSTANADAILHAFNWKYSDVTQNASQIAAAGYKKC